jgi:predicted nuclease of predicted toxin-antitoxin system
VRVKVDENLPQEVAQLLCENGHDAVSVFDQTLSGEDDSTLFKVCQDEDRALVASPSDQGSHHGPGHQGRQGA